MGLRNIREPYCRNDELIAPQLETDMTNVKDRERALKDAYAAFAAKNQRAAALERRRHEIEASRSELDARIVAAQEYRQKVIADYAAGVVDMATVTAARDAMLQAEQERADATEIATAIQREVQRLSLEVIEVRNAACKARDAYFKAIATPTEDGIRGDADLRKRLMSVFAAYCAQWDDEIGNGGWPDWDMMIADLFPAPTEAEIMAAVASFKREHPRFIEGAA